MTTADRLLILSESLFHANELEAGRRVCERALAEQHEEGLEKTFRYNRLWYQQLLSERISCVTSRLELPPARPGWTTFNPSILAWKGELLITVRSSNYRLINDTSYFFQEDSQIIRTVTLLMRMDPLTGAWRSASLSDPVYVRTEYPVEGLEDSRLYVGPSGPMVSATVRNASPFTGNSMIASAAIELGANALSDLKVFTGLTGEEHEKNWMPIADPKGGPSLGWMYAVNYKGYTTTIEQEASGAWQVVRKAPAPRIAKHFRGGSQLIPFLMDGEEGWLAVIHECCYARDLRAYEHRFVWFDASMQLKRMSLPFALLEYRTVEFVSGLASVGDKLYLTFGFKDAEAYLTVLDSSEVRTLLGPVPGVTAGVA